MRFLLACLLLCASALPAWAQSTVTIVVNFGAGGSADSMARLVAPEMAEALSTQVVVKNSTGAAGAIGAAEVARSRPDGTTLLLTTTGPMAIQPHLRPDLPYRVADLAPVCLIGRAPVVMMTTRPSGVRSVADLLARARAGGVNYGSAGPGSIPHIVMAALAQKAGVPMTHIPFRGSAEAAIALLRDDILVYADLPAPLRSNDLVAIGVMAEARSSGIGDTPTLREQGFDLVYSIWAGLYARAGTPAATLAKLEAACAAALRAPAVAEGFGRLFTPITFLSQREFAAFQDAEIEKFRAVVQATGVRSGD